MTKPTFFFYEKSMRDSFGQLAAFNQQTPYAIVVDLPKSKEDEVFYFHSNKFKNIARFRQYIEDECHTLALSLLDIQRVSDSKIAIHFTNNADYHKILYIAGGDICNTSFSKLFNVPQHSANSMAYYIRALDAYCREKDINAKFTPNSSSVLKVEANSLSDILHLTNVHTRGEILGLSQTLVQEHFFQAKSEKPLAITHQPDPRTLPLPLSALFPSQKNNDLHTCIHSKWDETRGIYLIGGRYYSSHEAFINEAYRTARLLDLSLVSVSDVDDNFILHFHKEDDANTLNALLFGNQRGTFSLSIDLPYHIVNFKNFQINFENICKDNGIKANFEMDKTYIHRLNITTNTSDSVVMIHHLHEQGAFNVGLHHKAIQTLPDFRRN